MANMISVVLKTPQDVQEEVAARFKTKRLHFNLSQEGLAQRAGVSLGSLKRFERTGLIAFDSLLKLSLTLDCLGDFDRVCANDPSGYEGLSLDAILASRKSRKKGRLK